MLLLVGVFAMHDSHNTHRWFRFGFMSFQPSELAKPTLVLFPRIFSADAHSQDGRLEGNGLKLRFLRLSLLR